MSTSAQCEVCGNEYDKIMSIEINEREYFFDCFECAIHALAPTCVHCGCRILGHGAEADRAFFCSAHCAKSEGNTRIRDRQHASQRPTA